MKQYCRYCSHCIYGDFVYCEENEETMSEEKAKRVNKCKHFEFNEMDVFDSDKKYKPRKSKKANDLQGSLF